MFVNQISIEKVFLEERFFQDSNIKLESWKDEFIIELLNWYNDKLRTLRMRKGTDCINEWKQYYQQIVRILYYVVIKLNIRDNISLKNVFRYFFEVEDDDPYRNDPDMISAEKLLNVYNYLVKKISNKKYNEEWPKNYEIIYPFVGRWDNEIMKDMYDHLFVTSENGMIVHSIPHLGEEGRREEEDDEDLEHDIKLLQEILDRLQKKVLTKLKKGDRK